MKSERSRLRIGIDGHVMTGKFQGTRTTLTNLLQALARLSPNHEILVYTDEPDEACKAVGPNDFTFRPLGHVGPIKRLLQTFPRLLRDDAIDVAVFQYNAPLWCRAKRIVFVHDILPISHPQFFPLRNRLRVWIFCSISVMRAALVVAVSNYTKGSVQSYYKLPSHKIRTIFNGPSFAIPIYSAPRTLKTPRYVMTVGRIEQRKNIALLVEAFLLANVPDLRLVVVGSHDLGYSFEFPNDARIINIVGLDDVELIDLYRGASLFIYPSAAEGFGIPLLDAMLFGIPCVASNQTSMREIAANIVQTFDPTVHDASVVLAQLIMGHFGDAPIPAPTMAQREQLRDRFSWDRAAADFIAAVEAVHD